MGDSIQNLAGGVRLKVGSMRSIVNPMIRASNGPLVIMDNYVDILKKISYVDCKGKAVAYENEIKNSRATRNSLEKVFVNPSASSSEMKIYVNRFEYSNEIYELVHEIKENSIINVNRNLHFEDSLTTGIWCCEQDE
ncbi:hypothetical protein MA16_Dca011188 [Dendrobium catenatum]|uniref:Uncharacterized protein n=1 Tax=Dendrobium catenatum TaxID=906689 RepID=A0A2I0VIH2_9ASPA|nr:hypothetical protein MA16_Dca011188 [Dendrobium catenatum]